jgi:hypothetical protein
MLNCYNCKYFKRIANTDETGMGVCSFSASFDPVDVEQIKKTGCPYQIKKCPITCGDCNHFAENDPACFTADEFDDASDCAGFVSFDFQKAEGILTKLVLKGQCTTEQMTAWMSDFIRHLSNLIPADVDKW